MRNKLFIAKSVARAKHLSSAKAADQIDEVVHNLLRELKGGLGVDLPNVGKLRSKAPSVRRSRGGRE